MTILIIVIGKSLAAFVIVRLFRHPTSTALTISASLAQIGEFSFILASLGVSLALLPKQGSDLILAGAIFSILLNPLLFAALDWYLAKPKAAAEARSRPRDREPRADPGDQADRSCRAGRPWPRRQLHFARARGRRSTPLLVIENNSGSIDEAEGRRASRRSAAMPPIRR